MTKIKLEKILKATVNGMSFRFRGLETSEQRDSCNNICPLRNVCDRLPNPEAPRDKEQRFLDFCSTNDGVANFFERASIPDMTESEAVEIFQNAGYELYDKLPVV